MNLPTGDLVEGGYDEVGGLYRVPGWCLGEPTNLTLGQGQDNDGAMVKEATNTALDTQQDAIAAAQRREMKGKAKAVADVDAVKVKCRLSDRGGPDVVVSLGKNQPVKVLVSRILDETSVSHLFFLPLGIVDKVGALTDLGGTDTE